MKSAIFDQTLHDRVPCPTLAWACLRRSAAQDPSLCAMDVIREVLLGPRTDENAAERWLKLEAASHRGSGTLSEVTAVQRINTVGGKLDDTCDRPGTTRGMPYAADYVFLRK